MTSVGTFHAKTHLTELLSRVAQGEEVVITRRGRPVAMLVPPRCDEPADVESVVRAMLDHRERLGPRLGKGLSINQLRDEGRR